MFSLIITIISIALVAALALATLYFGGDAFNQGSAKAAAATVVNQAQQINGANTLYYLDNQAYATNVDTQLVDGDYLASEPNPGNISGSDYVVGANGVISLEGLSSAVCDAINKQAGNGVNVLTGDTTADADNDGMPDALASAQFGCVTADQTAHTFYFK